MRISVKIAVRFVCLLTAFLARAALAQTADLPSAEEIIERHVEATGGRGAYEERESLVVRGTLEISSAGISGALVQYQEPGLFYTSLELPGVGIVETGVKDGVAWEYSVLQGARIKTGAERAQALREATLNAAVRWPEMYENVEVVGMDTVEGEEAYEVRMTPAEGPPDTLFFSVDSGLAIKTSMTAATQLGEVPLEMSLGDYEQLGGVLSPTTMTQSVAGQTIRISLESAEVNVEIPSEQYEFPEEVAALIE